MYTVTDTDDVLCARIRLKPNMLNTVREWAAFMTTHRDAAQQTLLAEGVHIESVFLEQTSEGDFLIYYMRSVNQAQAEAVARQSTAMIDEYHRQFKHTCWQGGQHLELLIDLLPALALSKV